MTKNNLQIKFSQWLSENNKLLLSEFENWLHDNFNVNMDDKGVKHPIYDHDDYYYPSEFRLLKDDNISFICYNAEGEFVYIFPYENTLNAERKLYQIILEKNIGKGCMKEQAARYNLDLEWDQLGNLIIICRKLFCFDQRFILNICDDTEKLLCHFSLKGFSDSYKPFPDNLLKKDNGDSL